MSKQSVVRLGSQKIEDWLIKVGEKIWSFRGKIELLLNAG